MNGCRTCTDTALCRSCRQRNRHMPPEDMQSMQNTYNAMNVALIPVDTAALSAIADACGDGRGAFCGDI